MIIVLGYIENVLFFNMGFRKLEKQKQNFFWYTKT